MRVIYMGAGRGKTAEALRIANETGAYLVVRDQKTASTLSKLNTPPKRFPLTYDELLRNQMRGSYVRNIVIDDAEAFIQYAAGSVTIDAITITDESN